MRMVELTSSDLYAEDADVPKIIFVDNNANFFSEDILPVLEKFIKLSDKADEVYVLNSYDINPFSVVEVAILENGILTKLEFKD
jgi:hypothetical protein